MNKEEVGDFLCCLSDRLDSKFSVTSQRRAPTPNDDASKRLSNGDFWIDDRSGDLYILRDGSVGSAVWEVVPVNKSSMDEVLGMLPGDTPYGVTRMISRKLSGNIDIPYYDIANGATGGCVSINGGAAAYLPGDDIHSTPSGGGAAIWVDFWPATSATSGPVGTASLDIAGEDFCHLDAGENLTQIIAGGNPDLIQFRNRSAVVTNGVGEGIWLDGTAIKNIDISLATQCWLVHLENNTELEELNISNLTEMRVMDCSGCSSLKRIIAKDCDGAADTTSSSYYSMNLTGTDMGTDAVYEMIDEMADSGVGYPVLIVVTTTPASPAGSLVDGTLYTAAALDALATSKGYTLVL